MLSTFTQEYIRLVRICWWAFYTVGLEKHTHRCVNFPVVRFYHEPIVYLRFLPLDKNFCIITFGLLVSSWSDWLFLNCLQILENMFIEVPFCFTTWFNKTSALLTSPVDTNRDIVNINSVVFREFYFFAKVWFFYEIVQILLIS